MITNAALKVGVSSGRLRRFARGCGRRRAGGTGDARATSGPAGLLLTAALQRGKSRGSRQTALSRGSRLLANPELGTKQVCPNCQAKFYDLGRRPAVCPKCQSEFDPDEAVRNRRVRARSIVPDDGEEAEDQVRGKVLDDEEDEDEISTPEIDEAADEPPLVSDDDEDDVDPGVGPVSDDDLGEFADDEDIADDDVPFLEEEDDDFDDAEIDGLPDTGDDD